MKGFFTHIGDLTCGQMLAMSIAFNVVCVVVAALIFFQPTY